MNPSLSRKLILLVPVFVISTLGLGARAQDRNDVRPNPKEMASLSMQIEQDGETRIMLSLPGKLDDTGVMRQALSQSFSFPVTIEPARANAYDDEDDQPLEKNSWTLIEGHNDQAFAVQGTGSTANIHAAQLIEALKPRGIKNLWITVVFIKQVPNLKVSGASQFGPRSVSFYQTKINLENPGAAVVDLSWGYRRSDLLAQSLPIVAFILLPMLVTLWMSWSVSRMKDRPAEMWGRYFRYLARLLNVIWLVWFPVYAWSNLNEIVPVLLGPAEKVTARVVGIVLWFGPPILVMWLCHLLSGKVYRNVRGAEWSPADVVRRAILGGSLAFMPLFFFILIVSTWNVRSRYSGMFLILSLLSAVFFIRLLGKSLRLSMYSVTRGELRDRIFELAARAGVKLKQIYVLPEGKAQLSNAFARSDNAVMLTASLLRHLSKREVDAIMGHEIGHLKEKHPQRKRTITVVTLILANIVASSLSSLIDLQRWAPAMFSFAFAGSTFVLRFLSRSNERHADAIGIGLTGDPEAFISGLAKISKLNLMPMLDGGAIEFGTHPQTLGRLQDLARLHGVSPERLQLLLSAEEKHEDHYSIDKFNESQARIFATEFKQKYIQRISLAIVGVLLFTPILAALLLLLINLPGPIQLPIYLGGALLTFLSYQVIRNFVVGRGFGSIERRLRSKISQQGLSPAARDGIFVGLAPAAQQRRYEKLAFWDVGLLWFVDERMFYLGEEAWFVLNRSQIMDIRLGVVEPALLPRNCLYLDWQDEGLGSKGTFYLMAANAGTILQGRRQVFALDQRVNAWLKESQAARVGSESTPALRSPSFGEITSEGARNRFQPLLVIKGSLILSFIGGLVNFAFRVPFWSACYAIAIMIMLVVLDELPKLFQGGSMTKSSEQKNPADPRSVWAESNPAAASPQSR